MNKKIYYAHSMHLYGSAQEQRDITLLESMGFTVINPSSPGVQNDFKKHNESNPNREDYMDFFAEVINHCDFVAFRPHIDGSIPSGVGYEIKKALEFNKGVIELPNLDSRRFLSVEDTRLILGYLGQR